MKTKYYIGIDPGASGAIAILEANPPCDIVLLADWPGNAITAAKLILDIAMTTSIKRRIADMQVKAAVESVHAMPGQGVSSMFKFGANFGIWQGILAAFEIPTLLPRPHDWQRGVIRKGDGSDPKSRSIAAALRLFPQADIKLKKHHSRADALLIAWWLFQKFGRQDMG